MHKSKSFSLEKTQHIPIQLLPKIRGPDKRGQWISNCWQTLNQCSFQIFSVWRENFWRFSMSEILSFGYWKKKRHIEWCLPFSSQCGTTSFLIDWLVHECHFCWTLQNLAQTSILARFFLKYQESEVKKKCFLLFICKNGFWNTWEISELRFKNS